MANIGTEIEAALNNPLALLADAEKFFSGQPFNVNIGPVEADLSPSLKVKVSATVTVVKA